MLNGLGLFYLALSFYTRLPVPKDLDYSRLPEASLCLPFIGWIVGGGCALVCYFAAELWPLPVAVLLALVAGVLLTGAFHEDGFADVCDGFGGGYGKQQILTIMKDSRVGTYGALGLVLMLALKVTTLAALPAPLVPWVLLAGHSFSRLQPLLLMHGYDYARSSESKSRAAVFRPTRLQLALCALVAVLPFALLPPLCVAATLPVLAGTAGFGRYSYRLIGGYTGDCLGAAQQLAETLCYLGISALWIYT